MNRPIIYHVPLGLFIIAIAIVSLFVSCKNKDTTSDIGDTTQEAPKYNSIDSSNAAAGSFDIKTIKISEKPLGNFPYFELPEGYINYEKNDITDFDRSYFWVKDHFEHPQGKIFWSEIRSKEAKPFSELVVLRNLDKLILSLDGKKISTATVPLDSLEHLKSDQARHLKYLSGWGFIAYKPTTVYVVRRKDRNLWMQITPGSDGESLGWMILETKPVKGAESLNIDDTIKKN